MASRRSLNSAICRPERTILSGEGSSGEELPVLASRARLTGSRSFRRSGFEAFWGVEILHLIGNRIALSRIFWLSTIDRLLA